MCYLWTCAKNDWESCVKRKKLRIVHWLNCCWKLHLVLSLDNLLSCSRTSPLVLPPWLRGARWDARLTGAEWARLRIAARDVNGVILHTAGGEKNYLCGCNVDSVCLLYGICKWVCEDRKTNYLWNHSYFIFFLTKIYIYKPDF